MFFKNVSLQAGPVADVLDQYENKNFFGILCLLEDRSSFFFFFNCHLPLHVVKVIA